MSDGRFHPSFERWAARVRRRVIAARMLTGAAVGLGLGAVLAGALWWLRQGDLRPWSAALGLVGALLGLGWGWRSRWSDAEVALYLDARLDSREAISTALELRTDAERMDPARAVVVEHAREALDGANPRAARPRVLEPLHGLGALGAAAIVAASLATLPALPPSTPPPPGADLVQMEELRGLEKIEALEKLDARDAEQEERLRKIAEQARKLREKLAQGVERREALSEIARMRDAIDAERLSVGDKKNREGLEAAVGKLARTPEMKKAADALGNGDLTAFDQEMQRLANQVEGEHRDAAKKALEDAAKAARERGAEDVAKALEEQRELFERREAKAEALRELAKSLEGKLSDQARKDLEEFGESGSPEAQKRLAEALEDALGGLSEEERKRVAEKLQKRLDQSGGDASPMTREQIEDLAKQLGSPEGQKQLADGLKELARDEGSDSEKREQGLDDAERGLGEAQRGLGAVPIPTDTPGGPPQGGQGRQGGNKPPPGGGKDGHGGGSGGSRDEGTGDHSGKTEGVEGDELRAKASPRLDHRVPMLGATRGRGAARPGETANQRGAGAVGQAAPAEVSGVERSDVPEEYREQVGRYFQP